MIINFNRNHMKIKKCIFIEKRKCAKYKKYCKVQDHCHYTGEYRGAAHSLCDLKYSIPKQITIIFHNESNYDYCFIIKELAEEFQGQFTCLGENTAKYIISNRKKRLKELVKWRANNKNDFLQIKIY